MKWQRVAGTAKNGRVLLYDAETGQVRRRRRERRRQGRERRKGRRGGEGEEGGIEREVQAKVV